MDGTGNGDDNDRVHRRTLVEGVHSVARGESTDRSNHRGFHRENVHMSRAKPLFGEVDEEKESSHNKKRIGLDRSVPRTVEMPMVVHRACGDCQNCFRARMTRCILHFHNAVVMARCNGCYCVELLHSAVRLESLGETSCEKLLTGNGARNRKRLLPPRVGEVCPGWDSPKIRWCHPCFVGPLSTVPLVFSCHSLLPEEETPRCQLHGPPEMKAGNDTMMSSFGEDIGWRCSAE